VTDFDPKKLAAIRAELDHPIIDADGHCVEFMPAVLDELVSIAGAEAGKQLELVFGAAAIARELDAETRREQLGRIAEFCAEQYPSLRLFLFDARRVFSAPITVFGPLIGVIYVGHFYLAFRESARVKSLTRHFDWLVREAEIDAREAASFVARLRDDIG